jgi:hypothetical protein
LTSAINRLITDEKIKKQQILNKVNGPIDFCGEKTMGINVTKL